MSFMDWLFEKTPEEFGDAPRPAAVSFGALPASDDPDEPAKDRLPLEPVYTIIDYRDAAGQSSRRRITMLTMSRGTNAPMLGAVCHERNAYRAFRCDRIECFIEPDGEVIETRAFFRDIMEIDLRDWQPAVPPDVARRGRRLRDFLRPGLSILVAAARSDDDFHANELSAICDWAHAEARHMFDERRLGIRATAHDLSALDALIRRMRPSRQALRGYLRTVQEWHGERYDRFVKALDAVIRADGEIMLSEQAFLDELSRMVAADRLDRLYAGHGRPDGT